MPTHALSFATRWCIIQIVHINADETSDRWLDRWAAMIAQHAQKQPVLELGCGNGRDTETLLRMGHDVIALDLSADAIAEARTKCPAAKFVCGDLRLACDFPAGEFGVMVASLSLHYFSWDQTEQIVNRICDAMKPGGLLLCRVNSIQDVNHGALGYRQIEPNFYRVEGRDKRFFNRQSVEKLFAFKWEIRSIGEFEINRYEKPKWVWEIAAIKETWSAAVTARD